MHDPALDAAKSKGDVQAATSSSVQAKSNPVQGVFVVDKDKKGRLRAKFIPVTTGITGATNIEVLSGLAPTYAVFLGLRLLYGIGSAAGTTFAVTGA